MKGRGEYTGTYELRVTDITEEDDAQPANTRTTTLLLRNADDKYDPVEGRIDTKGDQDWFAVILVDGTTYQIDLEGRDTGKGSLSDPYLYGIYISSGGQAVQVAPGNDDGGVGYNARITFTPDSGDTYLVAAGERFGRTGSYTLTLTVVE